MTNGVAKQSPRLQRYDRVRSRLTRTKDAELVSRLDEQPNAEGWGRNTTLKIGREKAFVKRIPVTDLELRNIHSTRNHYRLPTFYSYGINSGGFGVFRELLTHQKTTDWVLEARCEQFPLMYDYRIVERQQADSSFPDLNSYIKYWNNSRRIGRFVSDRAEAKHEVLIFLEYFRHTVGPWLTQYEDQFGRVVEQTLETIDFLQSKLIVHFDMHALNLVTDGDDIYVTDFGLTLDNDFELNTSERDFLKRHKRYDEAELIRSLSFYHLFSQFTALGKRKQTSLIKRYSIDPGSTAAMCEALSENLEEIVDLGLLQLAPETVSLITRHLPVTRFMQDFLLKMRAGSRKNHPFDHRRLSRLLNNAQ